MTRSFYLSLAAAGVCGIIATAWVFLEPATRSWSGQASMDHSASEPLMAVANYPVRIELPPSRNAEISPGALGHPVRSGLESTILEPIRETVASWAFGEPRLAQAPQRVDPVKVAPASVTPRNGLLPAKFDIATFGRTVTDADTEFRARKPLIVGGERIGALELAMGQGSIVSVDRAELAGLLGDRAPDLSAALARLGTERVTFDTLRTREIRIRYDALSDAVVIEDRT